MCIRDRYRRRSYAKTTKVNRSNMRWGKCNEWCYRWCSKLYQEEYVYAHYVDLHVTLTSLTFWSTMQRNCQLFSYYSNRCDILEEIVKHSLPKGSTIKWNIRTVNTVYENLVKVIGVFEEIEDKCLSSTTSNEASGLRWALELSLIHIF